jgi:hypothetical protein
MEVGQGPNWGCNAKEKKIAICIYAFVCIKMLDVTSKKELEKCRDKS